MPVQTATLETAPDDVDQMLGYWRAANPDLDVTTKAVAMRLKRVAHLLDRAIHEELNRMDIEPWEAEMLMALRCADGTGGSGITAGTLQRSAQVSSGAITNRLARLEQHGWVRRDIDLSDRRQIIVTLTDQGKARADELMAAKTVTGERFFAPLDRAELERINTALKVLMAAASAADTTG